MKNISFSNIIFDATTAANEIIATVGTVENLTFKNCKFNSLGITVDRENYTIPSTNFVVAGDANGVMMTFQI